MGSKVESEVKGKCHGGKCPLQGKVVKANAYLPGPHPHSTDEETESWERDIFNR